MNPGKGTTPRGASSEQEAAQWVRRMFGRVARRYDLLNHLLSFQADRYWRAQTVAKVAPVLNRAQAKILDVCCGTGDLAFALQRRHGGTVFGSDFCHPMLVEAGRKAAARAAPTRWFEADALALPVADGSLDLITTAFGFRNLSNYRKGLEEALRALRPGGVLAILEFSQPPNPIFRRLYDFYSTRVLPAAGGLISGDKEAYKYLPESVGKFPGAEQLAAEMEQAGFSQVRFIRMTFGIVALHTGVRP